jgi:nitrite reductase (NO-forming)
MKRKTLSHLAGTVSAIALAAAVGLGAVGPVAAAEGEPVSVVRAPTDLPGPIDRDTAATVEFALETTELVGRLADGTAYRYWTFNDQVPGPMLRVREGDTVKVTLKNDGESWLNHSVDFHAVTGPGGGAHATQTEPGGLTGFTFKAIKPGVYVYHCATPSVAQHIANGMYGLAVVEPADGLPAVDREFYVMQGEIYTEEPYGSRGELMESYEKLLDEDPEYYVLNGAVGALTEQAPMNAKVGESVRIWFGVGGPNKTSSFHLIGEMFDTVYDFGSLNSTQTKDVQTVTVAPGGAVAVDVTFEVPGKYIIVDHALSRLERGLVGFIHVDGPENPEVYQETEQLAGM